MKVDLPLTIPDEAQISGDDTDEVKEEAFMRLLCCGWLAVIANKDLRR